MSNDFWEFSLTTYEAEGVAESALAVQDQMSLDINLILYASWLASLGLKLTNGHLAGLKPLIERWQREVVIPLRGVRRGLKSVSNVSVLRDQVKAIELSCEKRQQEMMWEYFNTADPLMAQRDTLRENLVLLLSPEMAPTPSWALLEDKLCRASSG